MSDHTVSSVGEYYAKYGTRRWFWVVGGRCFANKKAADDFAEMHSCPGDVVPVREVLPGDDWVNDYLSLVQRHAKLVDAIKVLKDWVDLPHSDQCSPEMNGAWELFCQIEREVNDE